jgi:poly-gamma-glutamate capsule biosynthesis protein CapA/YwtB (metallophosphatase superfamily)
VDEQVSTRARLARREARRRQIRRRRISAVFAVGLIAAAAAVAIYASRRHGPSLAEPVAAAAQTAAPAVERRAAASLRRSTLGSGKAVTLAFGGDVNFETTGYLLGSSPEKILDSVAPVLGAADIAMVNLETTVTDRGTPAPKAFVYRAPISAFAALRSAGVDVATEANNHGMDYGLVGLEDSVAAAHAARFPVVGIGLNSARAYAPYRVTVRGQRIAIIGATQVLDDNLISEWTAGRGKPGLASAKDEPRLISTVRQARATSDTVVVYLHWGIELQSCPSDDQRRLAAELVAAGADVVVGSHAHVLLGTGRLKKAFVSYGLGNFAFGAFRTTTSQTGVLTVTVTGRRIDGYRWSPAQISGGIPYLLDGSERGEGIRAWGSLRACTGLSR